jgi:hypothetical protein
MVLLLLSQDGTTPYTYQYLLDTPLNLRHHQDGSQIQHLLRVLRGTTYCLCKDMVVLNQLQ